MPWEADLALRLCGVLWVGPAGWYRVYKGGREFSVAVMMPCALLDYDTASCWFTTPGGVALGSRRYEVMRTQCLGLATEGGGGDQGARCRDSWGLSGLYKLYSPPCAVYKLQCASYTHRLYSPSV